MSKEIYFSIDIEANGPIPGKYSMTSLGCAVVEHEDDPKFQFYRELTLLPNSFINNEAEAVGKSITGETMTKAYLDQYGTPPQNVMPTFASWVNSVKDDLAGRPVAASFNSWDRMFVDWYLGVFAEENPFHIRWLDMKSYYAGKMGCSWSNTTKKNMSQKYVKQSSIAHYALEDAIAQAKILKVMMEV